MNRTSMALGMALLLAAVADPAGASTLMVDFGTLTPSGGNLTNSPLHTASGGSITDTTWNHVEKADIASGLLYSDGTAATGVAIDLGASGVSTTVDLSLQPSSSAENGNTIDSGIYSGDSVAKDQTFHTDSGASPSHVGVQVTGLPAGNYAIYMTGRNTSTTSGNPYAFDAYAGAGVSGSNFDVSGYATTNVYFATEGAQSAWVEAGNPDENYVKFLVSLTAGEALNLALAGDNTQAGTTDGRAFLSNIQVTEIEDPLPVLRVNRITGAIALENMSLAAVALPIRGYSIASTIGALNDANWKSIAAFYDANGDKSVDSDDEWTELSASGSATDLSEYQFGGTPGDAGSIAIGSSVVLSQGTGTWLPTPNETDLSIELALEDGAVITPPIVYEGNGGAALKRSDLNHDGSISVDDYLILDMFGLTDFSGLTEAQAYLRGDLDGDFDSDINDYYLFRSDYIDENGAPAFAAMLASVPEPSSLTLVVLVVLGTIAVHRRPAISIG